MSHKGSLSSNSKFLTSEACGTRSAQLQRRGCVPRSAGFVFADPSGTLGIASAQSGGPAQCDDLFLTLDGCLQTKTISPSSAIACDGQFLVCQDGNLQRAPLTSAPCVLDSAASFIVCDGSSISSKHIEYFEPVVSVGSVTVDEPGEGSFSFRLDIVNVPIRDDSYRVTTRLDRVYEPASDAIYPIVDFVNANPLGTVGIQNPVVYCAEQPGYAAIEFTTEIITGNCDSGQISFSIGVGRLVNDVRGPWLGGETFNYEVMIESVRQVPSGATSEGFFAAPECT